MKSKRLLHILFTFAVLVLGHPGFAKPPAITFAGGDGSSPEKAIVIKGATEETGVHAEYEYLGKHYPGYKLGSQALQNTKGRAFDVLEITAADGKKLKVYFDITAFFGK